MTGCPGLARATTAWRYFDGTFMLVRAVLSYTILDFGAALMQNGASAGLS
jgi:hypothetical protein